MCNDGEVGLYVCKPLFFLRIVLLCRSLNVGRWVCPVCQSYGEGVAFVWGCLGLGSGMLSYIYINCGGCCVKGMCRFPSEAVKAVW